MGSSHEVPLHRPGGMTAAADLSSKQFFLVKMTSTGVNVAGAGEAAIGVLQNDPSALGRAAEVECLGTSKCVAGAAITQGVSVTPDASGKAVAATTGDYIAGTAITAAGADGEYFTILLRPQGISA